MFCQKKDLLISNRLYEIRGTNLSNNSSVNWLELQHLYIPGMFFLDQLGIERVRV